MGNRDPITLVFYLLIFVVLIVVLFKILGIAL